MLTCSECGREGSRGFDTEEGRPDPRCSNREQCAKRIAKNERAKLADRCVDCLESGEDPKGTRKLATKDDGTRQPGPRCVTHWRARKKDISSQAHATRLASNFELTPDQYWALYQAQGCKCFICRKSTGKARRLAVDHDHLLALEHGHDPKRGCVRCIRALLCKRCNTLVGWLDVEALQRAIVLLADPPARPILCPEVTTGVVTDEALDSGAVMRWTEPIATSTSDGVTIDQLAPPPGLDEWFDEDFGIPQSDVGVLEFFSVAPDVSDNFWFAPVSE